MKILQLCPRVPFPPSDGGAIAMQSMSHGLAACNHSVKVLALNTKKHFVPIGKSVREVMKNISFESVYFNTDVTVHGAFLNLLSKDSYHITRFYSPEFMDAIKVQIRNNKPDIIQLEGLCMAVYVEHIRKITDIKIVLRAHNAEHLIWERLANEKKPGIKKSYFNLLARRLKQFDKKNLSEIDALVAITPVDAAIFKDMGYDGPLFIAPVGLDLSKYDPTPIHSDEKSLFHFGSMEWLPNEEAVKWFLENVWIKLSVKFPDLKLYLAGRSMPSWLLQKKEKNMIIYSDVKDPKEFIRSKSVMLVPVLSGSGMRVKIIEGLALGKAIVSSSIGAEGIDVSDSKNILIADSPEEFIASIERCLSESGLIASLGAEARKLAEEKYDSALISQKLVMFYESILPVLTPRPVKS